MSRDGFEAQFIAMLLDEPSLIRLASVEPDDFADTLHANVYKLLRGMKVDVTPVTVHSELEQCGFGTAIPYVESLYDLVPDDVSIEALKTRAAKLRENHIRRDTSKRLQEHLKRLQDPSLDLSKQISDVSEVLTDAGRGLLGEDSPTADAIIQRAHAQTQGIRFASGLSGVDAALTAHGMRQGHVWVIVAPYKGFKTGTALNIVDTLLQDNRSVSYVALEDNDIAFTEVLTAAHSGVPLEIIEDWHVDKITPPPIYTQALQDAEDWLSVTVKDRFRVYDASKHAVHSWKAFPTLVAIDKSLYNTDVVVIDYVQAWAEEHEDLAQVAQMLVKVAAEYQVCLLVLSQMPNDAIKNGAGQHLATKGSGSLGQATHVGIEVKFDKEQCFSKVTPDILKELAQHNVKHFLSMTGGPPFQGNPTPSDIMEVGYHLKTVRRGKISKMYSLIDPVSQKVLLQSSKPTFMPVF